MVKILNMCQMLNVLGKCTLTGMLMINQSAIEPSPKFVHLVFFKYQENCMLLQELEAVCEWMILPKRKLVVLLDNYIRCGNSLVVPPRQ